MAGRPRRMLTRIRNWQSRAATLGEEMRRQAPEQYLRLRDSLTGRGWQERLEALGEKDAVAYRWVCALNSAFDLEFELERLCEEIICRAGRNGVELDNPRPETSATHCTRANQPDELDHADSPAS